mmetsp:Transcript_31130/g.72767  ORF Transcript_31130/g.72767 Transcript_31130/m.72767 type:complete len:249 (-) Transcript_31130:883-1629(-)
MWCVSSSCPAPIHPLSLGTAPVRGRQSPCPPAASTNESPKTTAPRSTGGLSRDMMCDSSTRRYFVCRDPGEWSARRPARSVAVSCTERCFSTSVPSSHATCMPSTVFTASCLSPSSSPHNPPQNASTSALCVPITARYAAIRHRALALRPARDSWLSSASNVSLPSQSNVRARAAAPPLDRNRVRASWMGPFGSAASITKCTATLPPSPPDRTVRSPLPFRRSLVASPMETLGRRHSCSAASAVRRRP